MLRSEGIAIHEGERGYDFWRLCNKLRETVHQLGFRLATGPNFYNLMNQFPHAFLSPHRRVFFLCCFFLTVSWKAKSAPVE